MSWLPTQYDGLRDANHEIVAAYKDAALQAEYLSRFQAATAGLPLDAMYGLGAHSMPALEEALQLGRPRTLLEIGCGAGASAAMFLALDAQLAVVSVDNTTDARCLQGAEMLRERHGPRFNFINEDSRELDLAGRTFDLVFIDGGHDLESVRNDLVVAKDAESGFVLLDDWWPYLGPGVQAAVAERDDLAPVRQWGNLILMRRKRRRQ